MNAAMDLHEPVLVDEVLGELAVAEGEVVVDGTLGSAGHGVALARALGARGALVGLDRDPAMLERGRQRLAAAGLPSGVRVVLAARRYEDLPQVLAEESLDGADAVLLDLGINSLQIADASRGFSFMADGPLDARFDPSDPATVPVSEIVNGMAEEDLADLIHGLGEERHARRIARTIAIRREEKPFETTAELADAVRASYPARERFGRIHAATRTFQALRIAANDELGAVERGVRACMDALRPGGRLAVISYHSGEDRLVKRLFDEAGAPRPTPGDAYKATTTEGLDFDLPRRGARKASDGEIERNPRARSARLRLVRRRGGMGCGDMGRGGMA